LHGRFIPREPGYRNSRLSEANSSKRPVVLHARVVTGTGGGPDKTILNSPRFLSDLGYDSVCAYLHPPDDPSFVDLKQRAETLNAELISIPDRGIKDVSVITRMLKTCRERNVSIWHAHDYKSDALGLLLRKFHSMKLVSTVHGWGVKSKKTMLYHAVDRFSLKSYDRVICVSDKLLAECLSAGIPIGNLCEIDNAIDLSSYGSLPEKRDAKTQMGIDSEKLVVVAVGRLSKEKGFDILIQSFADLLQTGLEATLLIAGAGPERDSLQAQIGNLGCENAIRLVGHVSDPRRVYAAADVFALSSTSEGLPNSLLEAMACGVPVVATAVGAVPNVIIDELNGLLIQPGDAAALTLSLSRLILNEALRNQILSAGLRTIEEQYSFVCRMQKVAAVYDGLFTRIHTSECGSTIPEPNVPASGITTLMAETQGPRLASVAYSARTNSHVAVATQPVVARSTSSQVTVASTVKVKLTSTPETWRPFLEALGYEGFYQKAEWLRVLRNGLEHQPVCLQATVDGRLAGVLPLAFVSTSLFGRFLVSLPYLNSSGIVAESPEVASALVDRAIDFAEQLDVRYLELRHEVVTDHPKLTVAVTDKVHMRLALQKTSDELWKSLRSKLRSQVRKSLNNESLTVHWGTCDLLDEFYSVFTKNMRDLGTPPFSCELFAAVLEEFPDDAEFCCVRLDGQPVASGLLIHGPGVTQVPSASSLRKFNSTGANMLMYWHLLIRSIERGQQVFDFGRSSKGAGTYRFKSQWGAKESPAVWQHFVREGKATDMRPNSGKYDLMIKTWQKLPVWLTKVIGPSIVRGIP